MEVEIAVLVGAEVGTVEEVRLFLDGKSLNPERRFPQPVPGSPVGPVEMDSMAMSGHLTGQVLMNCRFRRLIMPGRFPK